MLPNLFSIKNTDAKSTCIKSAESCCIGGACAKNTCARSTYATNAFFAIGVCIKVAGSDGISIDDADRESFCAKDACVRGLCTVKYSKIHLQFFSILKIELFDICWWSLIDVLLLRYGSSDVLLKLETGVRVG